MRDRDRRTTEVVAIILATGISVALVLMTGAALWVSLNRGDFIHGVGENVTQVLIGWGGGMIGVLGAYVGLTFRNPNGGP